MIRDEIQYWFELINLWDPAGEDERKRFLTVLSGVADRVTDPDDFCAGLQDLLAVKTIVPFAHRLFYTIAVTTANKTVSEDHNKIIYVAEMKELAFALTRGRPTEICKVIVYRTENPKLLIAEINGDDDRRLELKNIADEDVNIITYLNTKLVHLNYHWEQQMMMVYVDLLKQECELERRVIEQALILATVAPDEMARAIMKAPGYMAVIAGEVAHLVRCVPVEVTLRHMEECYQEIPVKKGNESFFLSARTRIIRKTGTQVPCSPIIPQMFNIGSHWYQFSPKPVAAEAPNILKPSTTKHWAFKALQWLAEGGVYTLEELGKVMERILFPMERDATLSNLAHGATGHDVKLQGASFFNVGDAADFDKLADNLLKRAWGGFINFGTASAGVLGEFLLIRAVKLVIDTAIHGFALHRIYGFSIYLLGAVWDSVTNLLLHLGRYLTARERAQAHQSRAVAANDDDQEAGSPRNPPTPAARFRRMPRVQDPDVPLDPTFGAPNQEAGARELPNIPEQTTTPDNSLSQQSQMSARTFATPPVEETSVTTFPSTQTTAHIGALNSILKARAEAIASQMTPTAIRRNVTPVGTPMVHRKVPANTSVEYAVPKETAAKPPVSPRALDPEPPQLNYVNLDFADAAASQSSVIQPITSQGQGAATTSHTYEVMSMNPHRTVTFRTPPEAAAGQQQTPNGSITVTDPLGTGLTWIFPQSSD